MTTDTMIWEYELVPRIAGYVSKDAKNYFKVFMTCFQGRNSVHYFLRVRSIEGGFEIKYQIPARLILLCSKPTRPYTQREIAIMAGQKKLRWLDWRKLRELGVVKNAKPEEDFGSVKNDSTND